MKETNRLPVDPVLAQFLDGMDEKGVVLLTLKILNPEQPLHELSKMVWPDVGGASRRKYVHTTNVSRVIDFIARHPYQLALLLNSKLMPLAIATLYEGLSAKKENVRVTAAKEIIRLAQTTAMRLTSEEPEEEGTAAGDSLLIEGEFEVVESTKVEDADEEENDSVENPESQVVPEV
jgi:hypothetical protein